MTKANPDCPKCKGTGAYLERDPRPEEDDPMPQKCSVCFPEPQDDYSADFYHSHVCGNCGETLDCFNEACAAGLPCPNCEACAKEDEDES